MRKHYACEITEAGLVPIDHDAVALSLDPAG